jgi:murein DD-endopeptidase MepM/ murein hydrolase activator NlpD
MTSEQPPRDALRPLRPLPSIDVPLLRDERTALRSRRYVRLGLGMTLALAAGGFAVLAKRGDELSRTDAAQDASEAVPAAEVEPMARADAARPAGPAPLARPASAVHSSSSSPSFQGPSRGEYTFGSALSFRDALEKAGLTRDESSELIAALSGTMDFRRSHAEDSFVVQRDLGGELERFEYRASITQRYEAVRGEGGRLRGRQIDVPIRSVRVSRGGVVKGSLGDTLEALKLSRTLAGVFTEVFDGQIKFSTDTRTGDSFRILYDEEYVEDTLVRSGSVLAIEYKGEKCGLRQAFWHGTDSDGDYYDATGRALHGGWLRTPLRYDHISSPFGMRFHPVVKRRLLHNGIDYAASSGTPVRAAADGVVAFAGPKGPNGNLLAIQHAHGYETFYAHLSRFAPGMKPGTKVTQRQLVAYVGSTGRSTGPHLHFSLKRSGRFIDPATQLNGPGLPLTAKELPEFKKRVRDLTAALAKVPLQEPQIAAPATSAPPPVEELGEEEL